MCRRIDVAAVVAGLYTGVPQSRRVHRGPSPIARRLGGPARRRGPAARPASPWSTWDAAHPAPNELVPILFTTAHKEYAIEAFDADAYDYLLKPITREWLERALDKVKARLGAATLPPPASQDEAWRLIVTDGSLKRFVDAREVECFLADQKYVAFRWREHQLLVRESLGALATRLAAYGFVRVHRGALVRRDAVDAYDIAEGGRWCSGAVRPSPSVGVRRRLFGRRSASMRVTTTRPERAVLEVDSQLRAASRPPRFEADDAA